MCDLQITLAHHQLQRLLLPEEGEGRNPLATSTGPRWPAQGGAIGGEEDEGLPLGQLVALRQDGSTSAAAMKARARALRQAGGGAAQPAKKRGKHAPAEMSSKKPVPVLRDAQLAGGKR